MLNLRITNDIDSRLDGYTNISIHDALEPPYYYAQDIIDDNFVDEIRVDVPVARFEPQDFKYVVGEWYRILRLGGKVLIPLSENNYYFVQPELVKVGFVTSIDDKRDVLVAQKNI